MYSYFGIYYADIDDILCREVDVLVFDSNDEYFSDYVFNTWRLE